MKIATELIRDVVKGQVSLSKEHRGNLIKHANNMLGVATGWTNGEIGNMLQFLTDIQTGKAKPKTGGDWFRGLTQGKMDRPASIENVWRIITGGKG